MIYIYSTFIAVLCAYLSKHIHCSYRNLLSRKWRIESKLFMFIAMMVLASISAVRYKCGTDFSAYWLMYNLWEDSNKEWGFLLLIRMLHMISDNPQTLFIATSFFICGCYFWMIYKESINPAFSVFLFVAILDYFGAMNGIRQYMAIAIVMFAIPDIKNHNWIRALIILIIACVFHQSVLFLLLLFFLYMIEIKPILAISIVAGLFLFGQMLWDPIRRFVSAYTRYGHFFLVTSRYFTSNTYWEYILVYLSIFLLLCFEYENVSKNKNLKLLYTSVWMALVVSVMSTFMPTTISRMAWYYNPAIILYLPEAVRTIKRKKIRFIIGTCIVVAFTIYCIVFTLKGRHDVLPYQTYWDVFRKG